MPDSHNIHWTTDAELLAQFVMRHLESDQLEKLEAHLRGCPLCRDAVRAEQEIAAGVRRAGRDALKRRIARSVDEKEPAVSWYRIVAVAAAIVILVTLGITNKWFFHSETKLADSGLKSDSIAPRTEASPLQPPEDKGQLEKQQLADAAKSAAGSKRDQRESQGGGVDKTLELHEKDGKPDFKASEPVALNKSENAPMKAERLDVAEAPPPTREIWVEGEVLAPEKMLRRLNGLNGRGKDSASQNLLDKKSAQASMMSQKAGAKTEVAEIPVTAEQRSLSALPPARKNETVQAAAIQMLLRREATGLSITLFSDSAISQSDLRDARVRTVRDDSMILLLGNTHIGYRLPPGWLDRSMQQSRKAK